MRFFKVLYCFIILMICISSFVGCADSNTEHNVENNTSKESQEVEVTIIPFIDAMLYADIQTEELLKIHGEPDHIEKWNNKLGEKSYDMTIYLFESDEKLFYEFILDDETDQVVRMTVYSEKSWSGVGNNIEYSRKEMQALLSLLNIIPSNEAVVVADTGVAYRIKPVNDKVDDVWFLEFSDDDLSFGMVKVTFDSKYF